MERVLMTNQSHPIHFYSFVLHTVIKGGFLGHTFGFCIADNTIVINQ